MPGLVAAQECVEREREDQFAVVGLALAVERGGLGFVAQPAGNAFPAGWYSSVSPWVTTLMTTFKAYGDLPERGREKAMGLVI
ncbi:hypothetical protein MHM84_20475 [Halomonas sp. McH1-25]|uniref:hypothetical protein n=1 Tax=unclassified Halomonas TaxID=2609666 RepID=UPI001EF46830|nr:MULTISPECIES: hypothetical protein [unclassified Halomonas]MCG7602117.1 hypothetical protein [Halomonas sp. McH1-25]MCP1343035.1 hypothetical protein [Halomonas sp. FL8]MCP1362978.1 hypothetical protein [Halomonas sp. BBD45]MCP1364954.1 hypothetical protein [Halomonas sp. BBD48]